MLVEASIPVSFCCKRDSWPTSSHAGSNAESSSNAMSKFGIPQLNIESVFLQAGTSLAHTHTHTNKHHITCTHTSLTHKLRHPTHTTLPSQTCGCCCGVWVLGVRGFGVSRTAAARQGSQATGFLGWVSPKPFVDEPKLPPKF